MKVLLTDNAHVFKTPDGLYYTPTIYNDEFFQHYLNIFEEVRFTAKTKYVDCIDDTKYILLSRKGLEIFELPWYQGLNEMLKKAIKLIFRYWKTCDGCDCYIFRVPQIESYLAFILGKKKRRPMALEVVGDPASFGDIKGLFKWINIQMLKYMLKRANGASYVTEHYLQRLYPSKARLIGENDIYFESSYSSIDLLISDLKEPKKYINTKTDFEIIHVANTINGTAKGHIILIESIKIAVSHGYNIKACCIGDGSFVQIFKNYAEKIGIKDNVHFIGRIHSRKEVLERLSKSNLMVYPSYSEGLPRCIIEAMAVGLPCISTPVAGIPELLDEKYLFAPEDVKGIANIIMHLIDNPSELEEMSRNNVNRARKYTKEKLTKQRNIFYNKLRNLADQ
jgi:glycosyltransferase involved in cell wall biosynthesis